MTLLNIAWRVVAAVTVLVASPTAMGQVFQPFAESLEIDPDWQWFAPLDVEELAELNPRNRPNTGWFAAWDRTNLWVSRPQTEVAKGKGDFGWGNRLDVGFMSDKDSGWLFSFRNMGGPNVYDRILVQRINEQNTADTGDPNNPVFPPSVRNDPQLGYRAYVLGDSLNVIGLSNFEVNKVWRRTPYRYGGILEPMVGFKYSTLQDTALNDSYTRSNIPIAANPAAPLGNNQVETFIQDKTETMNRMVGGQLGARYFTHAGRWTLSGEFRAFGMANFQDRTYLRRTIITEYAGIGNNQAVTLNDEFTGTSTVHSTNQEFVFGFEARAEAAYQVTRYFTVRGGLDVLNFASGIWRGANPGQGNPFFQDQDVQMAGFTFGVTVNR